MKYRVIHNSDGIRIVRGDDDDKKKKREKDDVESGDRGAYGAVVPATIGMMGHSSDAAGDEERTESNRRFHRDEIKKRGIAGIYSHGYHRTSDPKKDYVEDMYHTPGSYAVEEDEDERHVATDFDQGDQHPPGYRPMSTYDAVRYVGQEKGEKAKDVLVSSCNQSGFVNDARCDSLKAAAKQTGKGIFFPKGKTSKDSRFTSGGMFYVSPSGKIDSTNEQNVTRAIDILRNRLKKRKP